VKVTSYLDIVLQGDKPHDVVSYQNRVLLISGNVINFSPYNAVTGWRASDVEYFEDGGSKIMAAVPHLNYLCVVKEAAIYGLGGNSYRNWTKDKLADIGTIAPKSVRVAGNEVFFLARNGHFIAWNGHRWIRIGKHVRTDVVGYSDQEDAAAVSYQGYYMVSFPTDEITLLFDPDTMRQDEAGDARVSFFEWLDYRANDWLLCEGADDHGYLLAVQPTGLFRCDHEWDDDGAEITMAVQTKYLDFDPGYEKLYRRMKVDVKPSGTYTLTVYADDGDREDEVLIDSGYSGPHHIEEVGLEYTLDGHNLSVKLEHVGGEAAFYGYTVDVQRRRY
jgi:hypothetical protein